MICKSVTKYLINDLYSELSIIDDEFEYPL
jgi:hypothetical protein